MLMTHAPRCINVLNLVVVLPSVADTGGGVPLITATERARTRLGIGDTVVTAGP